MPRLRRQTIPYFDQTRYALSTGAKLGVNENVWAAVYGESNRVRTLLYRHAHHVYEAAELLNSTPRDCPHHIQSENTGAVRLVSLPPPKSAIDQLCHTSPLVLANASQASPNHHAHGLYMS